MGLLLQSILRVDNIPGPLEEHAVALEKLADELGTGPAADLARLKAKMVRSWNGRRYDADLERQVLTLRNMSLFGACPRCGRAMSERREGGCRRCL